MFRHLFFSSYMLLKRSWILIILYFSQVQCQWDINFDLQPKRLKLENKLTQFFVRSALYASFIIDFTTPSKLARYSFDHVDRQSLIFGQY